MKRVILCVSFVLGCVLGSFAACYNPWRTKELSTAPACCACGCGCDTCGHGCTCGCDGCK